MVCEGTYLPPPTINYYQYVSSKNKKIKQQNIIFEDNYQGQS